MQNFLPLFEKSFFYALSKEVGLGSDLLSLKSRLVINETQTKNFHPKRNDDFIYGRLCASKAYELGFHQELLELPIEEGGRAPLWPKGVVGSISHGQSLVGAAVADQKILLGIGLDFETRGRVKGDLSRMIRTPRDLFSHQAFNEEDLLTLIFSAKESLFKALYPLVKKFFGFEAAALTSLNDKQQSFVIELVRPLVPGFGPSERSVFHGRFFVDEKNIFTVIEISHIL